jgi:hypothetical protein
MVVSLLVVDFGFVVAGLLIITVSVSGFGPVRLNDRRMGVGTKVHSSESIVIVTGTGDDRRVTSGFHFLLGGNKSHPLIVTNQPTILSVVPLHAC